MLYKQTLEKKHYEKDSIIDCFIIDERRMLGTGI